MDKFNKDLRFLLPISILMTLVLFLGLLFTFVVVRSLQIEEYCSKYAQNAIPQKEVSKQYPITEEERKQVPWLFGSSNVKIYTGFREVLKCEREQKTFFIF